MAVIIAGSAMLAIASADNQAITERDELCQKIIQLQEKYKQDFWAEEGHKFFLQCCTKEAVTDLAKLVEYQQELDYPEKEIALTFKKLSHACYGSNVLRGNKYIDDSFNKAKEFAKEAIRLDPSINDCLTLALSGQKAKHAGHCGGGVCKTISVNKK